MEPSDYQPIDCDLYSEYECAIVQQRRLQLAWRDTDGIVHLETVSPVDLCTRNRAEFLRVSDHREIRLDRILRHTVLPD